MKNVELIIGAGQVGRALFNFFEKNLDPNLGRGVRLTDFEGNPSPDWQESYTGLHIAFPYAEGFELEVVKYVIAYAPAFVYIHSTVPVGTTERIGSYFSNVAYTPVRGRHGSFSEDLAGYTKYVAAVDPGISSVFSVSLSILGFKVKVATSVAGLELAKLVETTYTGLLVAYAQTIKRAADSAGVEEWKEGLELTKEVEYLPDFAFEPGHIGGHCIMSNIALLAKSLPGGIEASLLHGIADSNAAVLDDGVRRRPVRYK